MYNGGRGNILNATIVVSPFDTLYVSVAGGYSSINGTTVIGGGGAGYSPNGGMWKLYHFNLPYRYVYTFTLPAMPVSYPTTILNRP